MDKHAAEALVTGYEDLIPGLQLPDPDDRHVLAAAIRCQADVIVTINLRDFPPDVLGEFGLEAQHPDAFIGRLFDLSPELVIRAARDHRNNLKDPAKSPQQYIETLERQGMTLTGSLLREFILDD